MALIEQGERPKLTLRVARQRAVMAAMVYGLDGEAAQKHGLEPGKPLGVNQAADCFHVRKRYVRNLLADPLFKSEMAAMLAAKRLAYMPEALDRVASIMRTGEDPVALRASETILGETTKHGVTVNVSQQTIAGVAIRPGYVIRMPSEIAPPEAFPAGDAEPR